MAFAVAQRQLFLVLLSVRFIVWSPYIHMSLENSQRLVVSSAQFEIQACAHLKSVALYTTGPWKLVQKLHLLSHRMWGI